MMKLPAETPIDKHDIFISYRSETGEYLAGRVKDALTKKKYAVFMDIDDLKSGNFDENLLRKIEEATDFIAILTVGCLDRCNDPDDYLRREIKHAFDCDCNIVPVFGYGFEKPESQPKEIADLLTQNGPPPLSRGYFNSCMDELASKFLKADPRLIHPDPVEGIDPGFPK